MSEMRMIFKKPSNKDKEDILNKHRNLSNPEWFKRMKIGELPVEDKICGLQKRTPRSRM